LGRIFIRHFRKLPLCRDVRPDRDGVANWQGCRLAIYCWPPPVQWWSHFTYSLLGGLAGLFGKSLQLAGFQQTVSIVSGLLILALVVLPHFGGNKFTSLIGFDKVLLKVQGLMAKQFQKNNAASMGIIGMLNGILPCGFVYIALAGAVSVPTVGGSMLYMALFGLGTFPLMFILSLSGKLVKPNLRQLFKRMQFRMWLRLWLCFSFSVA
jgi:sulfite exporter TauE/SafE